MIVTNYICDRCGYSQESGLQMWRLILSVRHEKLDSMPIQQKVEQLWCRGCVEKMGLLPVTQPENAPPTPAPTLEDIIRDMIREEIHDSQFI